MDFVDNHSEPAIDEGPDQPGDQEPSWNTEFLMLGALFRERVTKPLVAKLGLPSEDASRRLEALWLTCLAYLISRLPPATRGDIKRPESFSFALSRGSHTPEPAEIPHSEVLLLVLKPSKDPSSTLNCQLCRANLATTPPPRYNVLSYDSGDPSKTKPIELSGNNIEVSESLESALRHLRDRSKPRVFWVDPLCIDPGNGKLLGSSKGGPFVDYIFTRAQELTIWLGEESGTSALAFQYLEAFPELPIEKQRGLSQQERQKPHLCQCLEAIKELLNRPWWDRAGLLVKYMRGRRAILMCGNDVANWTSFKRFFDIMKEKEPMIRKRHPQYLTTIAHAVYILPRETAEDLSFEMMPSEDAQLKMETFFSEIISSFKGALAGPKPGVNWVLALFKVAWHLGPVLTHLAIKVCSHSLKGPEKIRSLLQEKLNNSGARQGTHDLPLVMPDISPASGERLDKDRHPTKAEPSPSRVIESKTFNQELQCWLRVLKALNGQPNGNVSGIDTAAQGMSSDQYVYEPLRPGSKEFRILVLSPSSHPASPIHCELIAVDLDNLSTLGIDKCPYIEMSDDLEDVASQDKIFLHGRPISINPNLIAVLHLFRDSDDLVLLWVAAICIDQKNPNEKSSQQRLKPLISQRASCLLIVTAKESDEESPILEVSPNTEAMENPPLRTVPGALNWHRDIYGDKFEEFSTKEKLLRQLVEENNKEWKGDRPPPGWVVVPVFGPANLNLEKGRSEKIYGPIPTSSSVRFIKLELVNPAALEFDMYSPIHCSLLTKDLDSNPLYDALSYTWGDPRTCYTDRTEFLPPKDWAVESFNIYCDRRPFSVTPNLYAALVAIRWRLSMQAIKRELPFLRMGPKNGILSGDNKYCDLIWIDQICIDQSNNAERSLQILLMNRIYRQAQNVLVWLGGEDKLTLPAIQGMLSLLKIKLDVARELQGFEILDPQTYRRTGIPPINIYEWLGLWALLNRSWFQRAWVVQEVSVAKDVLLLVGTTAFDFDTMHLMSHILVQARWVDQLDKLARECCEGKRRFPLARPNAADVQTEDFAVWQPKEMPQVNMNFFNSVGYLRASHGATTEIWHRVGEVQRPPPLQTLLKVFRYARATNPRDKIYAFIGLSGDAMSNEISDSGLFIVPDYEKSTIVVYTDAMKYFLLSTGNLDALSMKESESQTTISDLPSWVPDFSVMAHFPLSHDWAPWSAGDGLGTGHTRLLDNLRLELHGYKVATIQGILSQSKHLSPDTDFEELNKLLRMIPEISSFRIPTMTPKLRRALESMDVPIHEPWRTNIPERLKDEGMVKRQSRFEVFWRTLLSNRFHGKYPAPSSCGGTILEICDGTLCLFMVLAQMSDPDLHPYAEIEMQEVMQKAGERTGGWDWNVLKSKIGQIYRTTMAFRGSCSYEGDEPIYPPEFSSYMGKLESAWKRRVSDPSTMRYLLDVMTKWNQSRKHSEQQIELTDAIHHQSHGMNLFATTEGHLGKAKESVQAGDEVWILSGGSVPLILRDVGGGHYRLISDAYVHGIMHGEPCLGGNPPDLSTIVLV